MFRLHRIAIALLASIALGACGGSEDAATRTAEGEGAPATTVTATMEVPPPRPSSNPKAVTIAAALAPYERFGTDAAPGQFPRTI